MKKVKKLLLIFSIFAISNISVFAASGFETIINVPLGLSIGVPTGTYEALSDKGKVGFDSGVTAQIGYMIGIGKLGVSILGEFGYSYDSYKMYLLQSEILGQKTEMNLNMYTHSFQVGLLPKINIGQFAIGVGAGVKIPITATYEVDSTILGINEKVISSLKRKDIEKYTRNVIPYVKVTFDYSIYFGSKVALNIGAYLGYDFGLAQKSTIDNEYNSVDSFDLGLQLGLRFAPKL
ncbi:outer membrane beta-barrel protein [Brachyspira pilosicoli]|uniref:Serpentine_recp domain containing protein n=1 Tax=Brachyspira pilosicoli TaxID=52584 RepID=A0A5C8EUD4_BRAPL|nr:outer membrane beta-barrel protein [Brachyspira pilosicoli]TXJ40724.1 hypothetical protein EPJ72_08040 [Brachyspira pilosicoli]